MNKTNLLSLFFLSSLLYAQNNFDLKAISREQKKNIPWSLTGFAQDLRSDVKHALQQIMDSLTLLWPEAVWNEYDKPSQDKIDSYFNTLMSYVQQEQREDKKDQVSKSVDYILNVYTPSVEKRLTETDKGVQLEVKKELFGSLVNAIKKGRQQLNA